MKVSDFISVKFTLLLVTGIFTGYYSGIGPVASLLFTGGSFLLLAILFIYPERREGHGFGIAMAAVVVGMGMSVISMGQPINLASHYARQAPDHTHQWQLKITEVLQPGRSTDRYLARVTGMDGRKVRGDILLSFPGDSHRATLEIDDEITTLGRLSPINPPMNPGQFNYREYLKDLGIYHQLRLHRFAINRKPAVTLWGLAGKCRHRIISRLEEAGFKGDELGIVSALLLGERKGLSQDVHDDYRNAGAVHILAVSGLHIGILLLILQFLLSPLIRIPGGRTIQLVLLVFLLWGFALLAGFSASVVRSAAMFSFVAYALFLNRPGNTFNIVALSMFFILLLINPLLIFRAGFQMSYAAVIAIVWIYPKLMAFWSPGNLLLRKAWQLTAVSLAAQLGVLPLSLFYFHQFPGLFMVSNLLVVPFVSSILGIGILVIILAFFQALPDLMVAFFRLIIQAMNHVVGWLADREAFLFRDIPFDIVQVFLAYLIVIFLIMAISGRSFKGVATLLAGILLFQLWSLYLFLDTGRHDKLLILHQVANTVILEQSGSRLTVHTPDTIAALPVATDYKVSEHLLDISFRPLRNAYRTGDRRLVIIDSNATVPPVGLTADIMLLTQSPGINLNRYLDSLKPSRVLADGSNYTSYIRRWKKTCSERNTLFHYTGEKGAYVLETDSLVDISH